MAGIGASVCNEDPCMSQQCSETHLLLVAGSSFGLDDLLQYLRNAEIEALIAAVMGIIWLRTDFLTSCCI